MKTCLKIFVLATLAVSLAGCFTLPLATYPDIGVRAPVSWNVYQCSNKDLKGEISTAYEIREGSRYWYIAKGKEDLIRYAFHAVPDRSDTWIVSWIILQPGRSVPKSQGAAIVRLFGSDLQVMKIQEKVLEQIAKTHGVQLRPLIFDTFNLSGTVADIRSFMTDLASMKNGAEPYMKCGPAK